MASPVTVFMVITDDEFELPIFVSEDKSEVCKAMRIDKAHIWEYLDKPRVKSIKLTKVESPIKVKLISVEIDLDEEY